MTPELVLTTHRDVFYRAIMEQDWGALAHLYEDDYMLVRSDGSLLTKGEVLDDLRAHNLVFESIEIMEEKVRIIDSVAVLTGKSRTVSRHAGIQVISWFRLVAVYVEAADGLKLVHFQSTPLPSQSVDSRPTSQKQERTIMNSDTPQLSIESFVGTWQLESFTETLRDGRVVEPMGKKPQGFLLYTQDGIVSAQLSGDSGGTYHDPFEERGPTDKTRRTAPYIGYCGKFTVNSERQEVIHSPVVAHDGKLIGLALRRHFRIHSDRLTLTTLAGEAGTDIVEAQLVWRRYRVI